MYTFAWLMAVAALAHSALAIPTAPAWNNSLVTRQDSYTTTVNMGKSTLNWGDGSPSDVVAAALNARCGSGTQCDPSEWSEDHTVCPDNTACNSCQTESIVITAAGMWPPDRDDIRQAMIAGLQAAMGVGIVTSDASTCPIGGGPYSAYYPGYQFTANQQASFVGVTVYDGDDSVASMTATITVQEVDDNWCGDVAPGLFGAGGAIATAVDNAPGAAVFGLLSAICA